MSSPPPASKRTDYTVGWLTALPIELAAAEALLDVRHLPLDRLPHDSNSYILGSIGKYNVVLTSLPNGSTGSSAAAFAAAQMMFSFPATEIRFMTGIGGGIPTPKDVRLGDVVVSVPGKRNRGIFPHDFGQIDADGKLQHTHILDGPPPLLLNAVTSFRASSSSRSQFLETLSKLIAADRQFAHPGVENDRLYNSSYKHPYRKQPCDKCDPAELVQSRPAKRENTDPSIHYGGIASGNQVIKHTSTRDRLGLECEVLCFEMESAGLMNYFSCLVVRGISDYADSHKNNDWKPYAAATAAAYTKALLVNIPPLERASATAEGPTNTEQLISLSNDRGMALTLAYKSLEVCVGVGQRVVGFFRDYTMNLDKSVFESLELSIMLANGTAEEFQRSLVGLPIVAHSKIPRVFDRLALLFEQLDVLLRQYSSESSSEISKARWAASGKHAVEGIKAEIDKWLTQIYPMVLTCLVRVGVDEILQQKAVLQGINNRIEELHDSVRKLPALQEGVRMRAVQEAMDYSKNTAVRQIRVHTSLQVIVIDTNKTLQLIDPELKLRGMPSSAAVNFQLAEFSSTPGGKSIEVLLEHRPYDSETESQVRETSNYIANVISKVDPEQFNVPLCLHYFNNRKASRYSLIFGREFTVHGLGKVRATHYTLADVIQLTQQVRLGGKSSPPMDQYQQRLVKYLDDFESRSIVAVQLVRALSYIHAADLLHKSIRSDNIILCLGAKTSTYVIPLLMGFHRARRVTDGSTKAELDEDWNARLYRHPARWRKAENLPFTRNHDVYSLGVVLLELGLGRSASSIVPPDLGAKNLPKDDEAGPIPVSNLVSRVALEVVEKFVSASDKRLMPRQGPTFTKVVKDCLTLGRDAAPDARDVLDDALETLLSIKY